MATSVNEQEYKGNVINYLDTTGNTAITLSSNGLTLSDDILTTPVIVEINQVGIVNGGNTTTWNTLASLDQALASLKIPPNATTLEIENTLLATNGATNSISINASTPNIVITDGTITNTIDKNGYTTRNNVQNSTKYLNFSDSSTTGTGEIQKTTGISCNPSTNTVTATSFVGDITGNSTNISITDTNTSATYYPTFVDSAGSGKTLRADIGTGPFSINPNTGVLNFATTMKITSDKIGLGGNAGIFSQGNNAVAIGLNAGNSSQGAGCVAIGVGAGQGTTSGQGASSVAIGSLSGQVSQGVSSVAIGQQAGNTTQGSNSVAIGASAGRTTQGSSSIAIGNSAGFTGQGANSIAIGSNTGVTNQTASSIAINASGVALDTTVAGLHINPIRNVSQTTVLGYDTTSKEITYYPTPGGGLTVETVTGTTALSPTDNVSIVSGSSHTLPVGTSVGTVKTIVNNNPNVFERVLTSGYKTTSFPAQNIRVLKYDPVLNRMYVGGNFINLNNVTNCSVCCYYDFTTSTFVSMGTFTGTDVYDILISGTRVYITGAFTLITGYPNTIRIAYFDTITNLWNAMGTGLTTLDGQSLLEYSGSIYVCGSFASASGVASTQRIARWDIAGSTWNALGPGIAGGSFAYKMVMFGTRLWVGGNFPSVASVANTAYLAYWDTVGLTWNGYGATQLNGNVLSMINLGGNNMGICGAFSNFGSTWYQYTLLFDQSAFTASYWGYGSSTSQAFFQDTDGLVWYLGTAGALGTSEIGFENTFYSVQTGFSFMNSSTNQWVPVFAVAVIRTMEKTGTPGEYWCGGNFNAVDNIPGFASIVKINKNNITTINSTISNFGIAVRNNFNLYYKGQVVNLVNYDNSEWSISPYPISTQSSTPPQLILY